MDELDRAYLAGFIDGEGSIVCQYRKTARGINKSICCQLLVFNTNEAIIEWVKSRYGGKKHQYGKPRKTNHKQIYSLYWAGEDALPVLKDIEPFVKVKKRQLEIVIELIETQMPRGRHLEGGLTPELIARRDVLVSELTQLNRRGVNV